MRALLRTGAGRRPVRAYSVTSSFCGRPLTLDTGRFAPLTDGAVLLTHGGTCLLATAVAAPTPSDADFLPLTVEYRERAFAFGALPSSSSRREPQGSDREVLIGRLVDRALRPLFPAGFFYDTQLTLTLLAYDGDCDPAALAVSAASAALHASSVPWAGPAACVRVGWEGGAGGGGPLVWPTAAALRSSGAALDMLYAGAGRGRALMVELGARQLPEASLAAALLAADEALLPSLALQEALRLGCGKPKREARLFVPSPALRKAADECIQEEADKVFSEARVRKELRGRAQGRLIHKAKAALAAEWPQEDGRLIGIAAADAVRDAMRRVVSAAAGAQGVGSAAALRGVTAGAGGEVGFGGGIEVVPPASTSPHLYSMEAPPGSRIDGRGGREVRQIKVESDLVPGLHGTGLFSRGDTQVFAAVTLGPRDGGLRTAPGPAALLPRCEGPLAPVAVGGGEEGGGGGSGDEGSGGMSGGGSGSGNGGPLEITKDFFLHYDFPPYATNEVGKLTGINRRMVGHGALAEKALSAVMPWESLSSTPSTPFPYAIRLLGETTGSDGSSSMATVCAGTVALLDAGVPLLAPVAGVSIGAITDALGAVEAGEMAAAAGAAEAAATAIACGDADAGFSPPAISTATSAAAAVQQQQPFTLLTDILGLEDYMGDMDFKVAGTETGITALQLDVKPAGIPLAVLLAALPAAREGRVSILAAIAAALPTHRPSLKPSAPRVLLLELPAELRSKLLGPGGSNARRIEALSGARLVLDLDSTQLSVYGAAPELAAARALISASVSEVLRASGSPLGVSLSPATSWPKLTVGLPITARVAKCTEFGVVLEVAEQGTPVGGAQELGWMHIADFAAKRTARVSDVLAEGDVVHVQVCDVDSRGRGKFSMKALLKQGEEVGRLVKKKEDYAGAGVFAPRAGAAEAAVGPAVIAPSAAAATRQLRRIKWQQRFL